MVSNMLRREEIELENKNDKFAIFLVVKYALPNYNKIKAAN